MIQKKTFFSTFNFAENYLSISKSLITSNFRRLINFCFSSDFNFLFKAQKELVCCHSYVKNPNYHFFLNQFSFLASVISQIKPQNPHFILANPRKCLFYQSGFWHWLIKINSHYIKSWILLYILAIINLWFKIKTCSLILKKMHSQDFFKKYEKNHYRNLSKFPTWHFSRVNHSFTSSLWKNILSKGFSLTFGIKFFL